MLLSLILIAVVATIAYFHLAKGFFSGFLSLVICLVSAAAALGMHEQIVNGPLAGKMGDYTTGLVLCGMYAVLYYVLRTIFDMAAPGNVNFGVWPDRVGGLVMGAIAGAITAGILYLGASSMPFQPIMAGYAPYEIDTIHVQLNTVPPWAKYGRGLDIADRLDLHDKLKDPEIDQTKATDMLLPVDKYAQSFISAMSAGALSGQTKFSDVHPNYSLELFMQRLGMQPGAKRVAFPTKGREVMEVHGTWRLSAGGLKQIDGDLPEFRVGAKPPPEVLRAGPGKTLFVVRFTVTNDAGDKDNRTRFATSSFRLVAGKEGARKNYYPVATVRDGSQAVYQHPDDFLIVEGTKGADLVFEVDNEALMTSEAPDAKIAAGTIIEFKRATRFSLADKEAPVVSTLPSDPLTNDAIYRRMAWEGRPVAAPQ